MTPRPPQSRTGRDATAPARRTLLTLVAATTAAACSPAGHRSAVSPEPTSAAPDPAPPDRSGPTPSATDPAIPTASEKPRSSATTRSGPATEVGHGARTRPAVALTFHGSGRRDVVDALLDIVDHAGVTVTVLAVGTWLAGDPGVARRILQAGHELGNHTMHHLPMRTLDRAALDSEIVEGRDVLSRVVGSTGRWFRASGTQHTTAAIRAAAGRAGYARCLSYDVDGLDWQDPPAATVVSAVLGGARPGSVISLHLGHPVTVAAMPAVLSGLAARSLTPVGCTDLLG